MGVIVTLGDYLRVLRARWRVAVAVAVLGVLVAGLVAIFMPPSYQTKVDIFFTSSDPTTNVADRVAGYAPLVRSDFVTSSVVGQLRLPETPQEFARHVTVTSQPNSPVLTASVQLALEIRHASWFVAPSIASRFRRNACIRISRACTESDVRTIDPYCAFSRITNKMSSAF